MRNSPFSVSALCADFDLNVINHFVSCRYFYAIKNSVEKPLQAREKSTSLLQQQDLHDGYGEVYMPYALARKYPRAASELVERAADALPGRNDPTGLLSKFGEALCNLCSNGKNAAT